LQFCKKVFWIPEKILSFLQKNTVEIPYKTLNGLEKILSFFK